MTESLNLKSKIVLIFLFISTIITCQVELGSYVGDGNATKAISGIGFAPKVLLVKPGTATSGWIATSSMPAGTAKSIIDVNNGLESGMISSFDADGFTVSQSSGLSNESGITYHYVAFGDAEGNIDVGNFEPSTDGVAVSVNVGYRPKMVWLLGGGNLWHNKMLAQLLIDDGTGTVHRFHTSSGNLTGGLKSLESITATGFDTEPATTNTNATPGPSVGYDHYHYVTFKENINFQSGTYAGDDLDPDKDVDFEPDFVMVVNQSSSQNPVFKTSTMAATSSYMFNAHAGATDLISGLNAGPPTTFSVGTNGSVGENGSNYSFFAIKGGATVLPVEWVSFNCSKYNEYSKLTWTTASEINSSHFIIERSINGIDFFEIGNVEAQGNTSDLTNYTFFDKNPKSGINYYRLKQVDFDKEFEYSNIRHVNHISEFNQIDFNLFPNPAIDVVKIISKQELNGEFYLKIYDATGRVVYINNLILNKEKIELIINLDKISKGIYLVGLTNNIGLNNYLKLIKK